MRVRALILLLSVSCVCGCGREAPGPEAALRVTIDSLRQTSGGGESALDRARSERLELADALEHASFTRHAFATLAAGETSQRQVVLVEEDGGFRVEAGVLGVPALDTPARAIAALHRALAREISQGPGVLLVEDERRMWLEERERYRDGTASPDALDVRVEGDRATALTPLGDEIVLLREGAEWRVASMRAAGLD